MSLRKITPGAAMAQVHARAYQDAPRITRNAALRVAKAAAAAMGLKAAKIALIDALFASSQPQDWTGNARPVVWPSNEALARRLGVTQSTMKHHLRGLVAAGLVAYAASPTFQRRGVRGASAEIVEAYGLDLSPIAVRYVELTEIAAAAAEEARLRKSLHYRRTVARREIEAVLYAVPLAESVWQQYQARFDRVREIRCDTLDILADIVDQLEGLMIEMQEHHSDQFTGQELSSAGSKFDPLQITAQNQNSEHCNMRRDASASQLDALTPSASKFSTEKKDSDGDGCVKSNEEDIAHISLGLLKEACPDIQAFLPDAFASWGHFRSSTGAMGQLAAINPQVLDEARSYLGSDMAAVAAAITLQRHSQGDVMKPGAYLRTLVKRGRAGELYLSKSLFSLAARARGHDIHRES